MPELSIIVSDDAAPQAEETAIASLRAHTVKMGGVNTEMKPFSVLASANGTLIAGVIGKVFWNWLYADLVWVKEGFRGQGIGTRVMKVAEERARQMNLTGIYLWTQTWQAPGFYQKLGYTQYVEFKDFPPGHSRLGFRKNLG